MTKDEKLKLALEALEEYVNVVVSVNDPNEWTPKVADAGEPARKAIAVIKEALAQPEQQKPYRLLQDNGSKYFGESWDKAEQLAQPEQEQEPVAWVDPATLHHLKIGLEGVHLVYETEMVNSLPLYDKPQFQNPKQCLKRLIRIMGTFDLATGHANTFDELLDSLESELRDVLGYYRQQRTWVGLTDEEIAQAIESINMLHGDYATEVAYAIEAKLKDKNS